MGVLSFALVGLAHAGGHVVTMDWSKCCDCEQNPDLEDLGLLKPVGEPCAIEIYRDQSLRLLFESSTYMHNLFEVASQEDLDTCTMGTAVVDGIGGNTMDQTLDFDAPGTYFYACSVMCTDETAAGGEAIADYCHCTMFSHKLVVTVLDEDHPTENHDHDHDDESEDSTAWRLAPMLTLLLAVQ
jgi:hypothetical protein